MGNADVIRTAVRAIQSGDIEGFGAILDDSVVLRIPGSNKLSGEYKGKQEVLTVLGTVMTLTGGEFKIQDHDILGSEEHAVGVYNMSAKRDGKTFEWQHVNVYHLSGGKVTEVFQFPGNFEAWNKFFS